MKLAQLQLLQQLKQTALAMALICLPNLVFAADIVISSALTGVQSIESPMPGKWAGKLRLTLLPRAAVSFPSPFDVSAEAFSMCISAERDAPDLFVSASLLGLDKTPVSQGDCAVIDNVNLDFQTNPNRSGKIVTLLLAPE